MAEGKEFRHLVRVISTDLDGSKEISQSLRKIKGVGQRLADITCHKTGIDTRKKTGELSDAEVQLIEKFLTKPQDQNIPHWILNRRKDVETGEDKHLLTSDLKFTQDNDKRRLAKTKSRRGLRLAHGLPVRGQKTKSNFRRNKGKGLGVSKKKDQKGGKK